ncbi:hypothetical protein C9374_002577 [Naegleria lovaniensis]|uniref:Protein kinase domain-containing protein n=1 Tax=Naegleria lovaniensis TaxID=51637 RepID=A0AA88GPT6_NAELO|nr:uncharacterized protein C9374_002577 [Naegleria lovaniensis]KAG2386131.1 hypothetical protein C9374_002577 [Naegleria lovaniensis]
MSGAYQLLLDCLHPTKIDSLGEGSELFHINTKYHKLLQLPFLYGFKMNAIFSFPNNYKYHLFNVGVFPIEPSTEEEKQHLDTLISFLLEASRQTIFEENEWIKQITQESIGRKRLTNTLSTTSDFSKGDKLVIHWQKTTETSLTTTVTLKEYLFEISTIPRQGNIPKDIFFGEIDHSSQPVFVKIFHSNRFNLPLGNIFLPSATVEKNGTLCSQYMEISIQGKELNSIAKTRSPAEKIHIIIQLLLEIDNIHTKKIIHNDVKPSNIIIVEKQHFKNIIANEQHPSFYCKFIDFELAKTFDEEDGDVCYLYGTLIQSTAGTSKYNAPEKEIIRSNFIHPKTDIFSLGLVFIELIIEREINKKQIENMNDEIWTIIEAKCKDLDTSKGQIIFTMLQKMVNNQRKERITARQCLQLLDITETVDTQDYTSIFFPDNNQISLNCFNNVTTPSMHDTDKAHSLDSSEKSKKIVSIKKKQCCKCITGNCRNCRCSKEGCTSCKSSNCDNKRKSDNIGGSENVNHQPESKKVKK